MREKTEETLIIVKPDGIRKGAVELVLNLLARKGLEVVASIEAFLTREWVAELYKEHEGGMFFPQTLDFMTSAPVVLMKVRGTNAVHIAKFEIVGRYPDGIRGKLARSMVENVAHASESKKAAKRELELAAPLFDGD